MANPTPMSVDELNSLLGPSQKPAQPAEPTGQMSQEELTQLTAPKEKPTIGFGEDVARSAGAGFGRGALGLIGMPGDIRNLVEMGLNKAGYSMGERYLPTSEEVVSKAKEVAPSIAPYLEHEPQYPPSKYVKTAAEFLPSAIIPGGGLGLGARAAGAIGAGVATQATEDYFKGTPAEGTGWEMAAKLAAGIPGFIGGQKVLSGVQSVAGGALRPGAEATRRAAIAQGEDIARGGAYGAKMTPAEVAATGAEMPPAATAGKSTQKLIAESGYKAKPEAVGAYEAALEPIREGAPQRMKDYVNNLLGITDDATPFEKMIEARRAARSINDQNYQQLFSAPQAQSIMTPELGKVLNSLPGGVLEKVADNLRQSRLDPASMGFIQTPSGFAVNPQGMPLKFWDEIKQGLDTERQKLLDPVTGRLKPGTIKDDGRFKATNDLLKNELDRIVPQYASVRSAGAEALGSVDAIDLGSKYLSVTKPAQLENIERVMSRMSPSQREDFAYGLAGAFKQKLELDPKGALTTFQGSKGGDRIRRLNEALSPFGDGVGYQMVGRANAELLNSQLKSIGEAGALSKAKPYGLYATGALTAASELAQMILQPALWSGSPTAFGLAAAQIGLGKLYNWKEARVAGKVLELMADPAKHAELGKLAAQNAHARSFIGKTQNYLGRAIGPGAVSDAQRYEEEQAQVGQPAQGGAPRASGGRVGRASGGRLPMPMTAERLMRAAHAAKLKINKTTEQILDQPDETVVKALDIANRHI